MISSLIKNTLDKLSRQMVAIELVDTTAVLNVHQISFAKFQKIRSPYNDRFDLRTYCPCPPWCFL